MYASHLTTWRRQREAEGVAGLSRKRGPKADPDSGAAGKIAELERSNRRLTEKLRKAGIVIEFQKTMAEALGTKSKRQRAERLMLAAIRLCRRGR